MKIVETNIIHSGLEIEDHQSRVLEIESWDKYCDLYRWYEGEAVHQTDVSTGRKYTNVFNNLVGCILPKNATITDLKIDEVHLTCNMTLFNGNMYYKLAYVVEK